jgi:hypothetical protein
MSDDIVSRMMRLFDGYGEAYGTYRTEERNGLKGGKLEIKKTARSVREPVTKEVWQNHLNGTASVGIIPIRDDDTCVWGCIDVDQYDLNHQELVDRCIKLQIPLALCKSKSEGGHLFLFLREPVPAVEMQQKLREFAATLGLSGCEIFPKQSQVLISKGDLGNWLNMPYFGGDKTSRYCVKKTGAAMTMVEFLEYAEARRYAREHLDSMKPKKAKNKNVDKNDNVNVDDKEDLEDGPPCLQYLSGNGFPEGTRNPGLFALGTFCKKKFGVKWREVLEEYNRRFMSPPLAADEVQGIIKSLEKKDYQYRCKDQPMVSHCNSVLCRMRKYGVGGGDEYPSLSGLSVLDTDPPLWFADVGEGRVELTTEQLQNYRLFHRMCMERLHTCYGMLTQDTWLKTVGLAMRDAIKIDVPLESGVYGHFLELLQEFCTNRHRARDWTEISSGKPWHDDLTQRYYFRLQDFMSFLDKEKFRDYTRGKVSNEIRKMGGQKFFNDKGAGFNTWWVRDDFGRPSMVDLPPSDGVAI